jgi:spectinomycin phosphotransferase
MQTPPVGLREQRLAEAVASSWGLAIDRLRYLPEGFGSYHWIARTTAGEKYFLTVDDLDRKPWLGADRESAFDGLRAAFDAALTLRERAHLQFVVSPVRALGRETLHRVTPRYSLAVFPYIDGHAGLWGDEIAAQDRHRLVRLLAELHLSTPAVAGQAPRRDIQLPGRPDLEAALTELDRPWTGGPFSEPARHQLRANADGIIAWLESFDHLAAEVAQANADWVITHGEPHPGNLIRSAERFLLIDWDTVALAPPERDLWMLDDGRGDSLAPYREATGQAVDDTAIALYRLAWTLTDLAAFVSLLRSGHQANQDTEKAWRSFQLSLPSGMSSLRAPYRGAAAP